MERILIVGAHYDDCELGVGGTAAKLAKMGKQVYKLTLTNNVTQSKHLNIKVDYEPSVKESALACRELGIEEITDFEPIECCKLVYDTETMQRIENVIFEKNIDTVFMHFGDDMNQDHIAASKLCITAARHCKNILAYQSNLYILSNAFYPTFFVNITDEIDQKISSLNQYSGDHNRFNKLFQTCIERNRVWGYSNKCEYAEGFHIIKMLME